MSEAVGLIVIAAVCGILLAGAHLGRYRNATGMDRRASVDHSGASGLECPDCGSVEWRRSGTIVVGDATPGDTGDAADVFVGGTSDTIAWTCTCGRELAADDPQSLALDAIAPAAPWVRDGQ